MTLPSLPFPDDAAPPAARARTVAPGRAEAAEFQRLLHDRAAAAGREEQASARHGDRLHDPDQSEEKHAAARDLALAQAHAPLTIHAFNELLLSGRAPGRDPARPEADAPGQTAQHTAVAAGDPSRTDRRIDSAPRVTSEHASEAPASREAPIPAAERANPPRTASAPERADGADTEAARPNAARHDAPGRPPAQQPAAPAPVIQPAARSEPPVATPNSTAAGAIQSASAAAPGRRSGADAHLPRWMSPRGGATAGGSNRAAQATGRSEAFAARVSRGLAAAISRGAGDVTLRLNPESLGFLRVRLEVRPEGVAARFEASTDAARRLLAQNSETLRAALEARGWESAEIRVALLEEADASRSAAELLRNLAREGEALAQRAAAEPEVASEDTGGEDPNNPRSGKDGSEARRREDDDPAPDGDAVAGGVGRVWLAPGAVDVVV